MPIAGGRPARDSPEEPRRPPGDSEIIMDTLLVALLLLTSVTLPLLVVFALPAALISGLARSVERSEAS